MKPLEHHIFQVLNYRPGKLAQGTLAMTAGLGLRTLGQAGVFLIIARVLGVEAYGAYSAVLALAMVLGWFIGMGASGVMLRDTAREAGAFADGWGRSLAALVVTAPPALLLYLMLAWLLLPPGIHWGIVWCFGVAEIVFARLNHAAIQAYQGHERMGRAARLQLVPIVPRLAMLIPLLVALPWFSESERLTIWSGLYLVASMLAAGYCLWLLHKDFSLGFRLKWRGLGLAIHYGWPYAMRSAAGKIYADIDKLMLARMAELDSAGVYAVAYRFIDMASIPLASLYAASAARFFRAGEQGAVTAASYALRLLPVPLGYAMAMGMAFYAFAGMLPWLLGAQYTEAIAALRWLAWLPLVSVPRDLLQMALIGADHRQGFLMVMVVGAALNILLNLWAIPRWNWQGAAGATYASELFMIAVQLLLVGKCRGALSAADKINLSTKQ